MNDPRKRVHIDLPKTATICRNLDCITSMWPSLICDLLYTGIITRSQSAELDTSESNPSDCFKLLTRYTPSVQLKTTSHGANFVERVVANAIENSTPKELGELLAHAIELIGLDNIIAYAPDAFSTDAVAENIEACGIEHPTGQQSDQRTAIESGSLGQAIQADPAQAAELGVRDESKFEQVSSSAPSVEIMESVTDSTHSHETDTTASPVDGGTRENQVRTNDDLPDELVVNYPVESNNGIIASGTIENNEESSDETAPVIPASSEPIQTDHAESTLHRAAAPRNSDTELADKRSRYAKYAKF